MSQMHGMYEIIRRKYSTSARHEINLRNTHIIIVGDVCLQMALHTFYRTFKWRDQDYV